MLVSYLMLVIKCDIDCGVRQRKCDIDNAPHWPKPPVKDNCSYCSWNVDQSKPDSHYDSQIDPYISCILIEYVCSRLQHKC